MSSGTTASTTSIGDPPPGPVRRKHYCPEAQTQGGSWVFNTITGAYHMVSKTVQSGKVLPSPVDSSVYTTFYRIAAEMALSGDYSMMQTYAVPESFFQPNKLPDDYVPGLQFNEKLCLECSAIVERLCLETARLMADADADADADANRDSYGPYKSQLDLDVKPNLDELARSAKDGCELCTHIFYALKNMPHVVERHVRETGSRDFPIQIIGILGEHYHLMVWFRHPTDRCLTKRTKAFEMLAMLAANRFKFADFARQIGVRLSNNYLSDDNRDLFRLWFGECKRSHPTCNAYSGRSYEPPRRLVDVGDSFRKPHLVEPDPKSKVDYTTLSYCWGLSWNSRTTNANVKEHMVGIPMSSLSPTLRHAILLTRHFGIRYLWVDSLCIIQDSQEDWAAESVKMSDIYQNSVVTIAVPQAQSTMEGIFPEVPDRQRPVRITTPYSKIPLYIDSIPQTWDACVEEEALSGRAWVLQERLLSCRTLFFSSQQMFWECKTKRASQHQFSNLVEEERATEATDLLYGKIPDLGILEHLPLQGLSDDKERDYIAWYRMLAVYSTKTLTVSSDKLPALAGIAQAFKSKNDIYVGGTWLNDWIGGLLWEAVTPRSLKLPHGMQQPRAPSWSWASLEGVISFPLSNPDYEVSKRFRAGELNTLEGSGADSRVVDKEVLGTLSHDKKVDTLTDPIELLTLNDSPESQAASEPGNQAHETDPEDPGTTITIDMATHNHDGPAPMVAELLGVGHCTSDFLGTETNITLTICGHAEWVVARSSTTELEPPSTFNEWTGTFDDFTGNWKYVLDREAEQEPCKCLRMILCSTNEYCWALLLRRRPEPSHWERIGVGIANSSLVNFAKLSDAPRETVVIC